MKKFSSNEIREIWLEFFKEKNHKILPSFSLIPKDDRSILWINAGITVLKKYFDRSETPPSTKLANIQRVIRTNDIENVGITTRHHTFFEMLGNFSIGNYFKKEAIEFAWELLTSKKYFNIDESLLYITIYNEDIETYNLWKDIGIDENKIFLMNKKTNFWDLGQGPCGPSTEIFFDKGKEYSDKSAKELIGNDIENDRFIEIWNIVFSEYNNDGKNNYTKLPQKNIDTGAGLERLTAIFQNAPSNFETDLFLPILKKINEKSKFDYQWIYIPSKLKEENKEQFLINSYMKAISDFIRTISFAINDGAKFGPNGREYVLRKLLRKAVVYKNKLEIKQIFLHELVDPFIQTFKKFYPELIKKRDTIIELIKNEEEQFNKILENVNLKLKDLKSKKNISEESIFKLHETHGLPREMLKDVVNEHNLNWNKLIKIEEEFKRKSKSNFDVKAMNIQDVRFIDVDRTNFVGYEIFDCFANVVAVDGDYVVFDKTPFFATAGGQESDFGFANNFIVSDVKKNIKKTFIHEIKNNNFKIGDNVKLTIDFNRRKNLTRNHSGAHLLFRAIEMVTGIDMLQQGSKIAEEYMRFDFTMSEKLDDNQLKKVENLCKKWIDDATFIETITANIDDAKKMATSKLIDFEYDKVVRIVKINDNVIDLCAGTHVKNSKEIEDLKIIKFEKKGAGIFRIEATTGNETIKKIFKKNNQTLINDKLTPILNKINNVNEKLSSLKMYDELDFSKEINILNIEEFDFKAKFITLIKKINEQLKNKLFQIEQKIKSDILIELNKENILIKKYSKLSVQEVAKLLLSLIDNSKTNLGVIVNNHEKKVTIAFVLPKRNVSELIINRIRKISLNNNLKGSGRKQLYIFGGTKKEVNIDKLIEEIKKWEF